MKEENYIPYNSLQEFIDKNQIIFFFHHLGNTSYDERVDYGWFKDLFGNKFFFNNKIDVNKKIIIPKGGTEIDFRLKIKKG